MKFLKKSYLVEAYQLTKSYTDSIRDPEQEEQFLYPSTQTAPENYMLVINEIRYIFYKDRFVAFVETPHGVAEAKSNDWIVTDTFGARQVVSPSVFLRDFECVEGLNL